METLQNAISVGTTLLSAFLQLGNVLGVEFVLLFWFLAWHSSSTSEAQILSRRVFSIESARRISIPITVLFISFRQFSDTFSEL